MFKPVVGCDDMEAVESKLNLCCVSFLLKLLFLKSMLATTFAGTILEVLSLYSPHLPSINFVSVYDVPCPILCKSFTITLDPVLLYTFIDKSSCDKYGHLLGIRDSMSSEILETLIAFGFDTFTIPFSS